MRCFKGIICIAITFLLFVPPAGYSADMIYATGYVESHDSAGIAAKQWFAKVLVPQRAFANTDPLLSPFPRDVSV